MLKKIAVLGLGAALALSPLAAFAQADQNAAPAGGAPAAAAPAASDAMTPAKAKPKHHAHKAHKAHKKSAAPAAPATPAAPAEAPKS